MKGKNIAQIAEDMERERQVKLAHRSGSGKDKGKGEDEGTWTARKNSCLNKEIDGDNVLCCPLCRAEVRENAASCPRCGRRLKG